MSAVFIVNAMNAANGLYFRREDYASFWLRLLIDIIDVLLVGGVCLLQSMVLWVSFPPNRTLVDLILASWAVTIFCYFVVLKWSKLGTVGYRIAGVRIIGLDGRPPTFLTLALRLLFVPLGPLNPLLDLLWLSGDTHRQSIHDKLAHTYVVKRRAEPVGTGIIVYWYYDICGYNFLFPEVEVERGRVASLPN